jgi:hypothetical protein
MEVLGGSVARSFWLCGSLGKAGGASTLAPYTSNLLVLNAEFSLKVRRSEFLLFSSMEIAFKK